MERMGKSFLVRALNMAGHLHSLCVQTTDREMRGLGWEETSPTMTSLLDLTLTCRHLYYSI